MERKIQTIVPELSDLELATLVCLIANEHCIIRADAEDLDRVQNELELIATNTFGFRHATLMCSQDSRVEEFGALVVEYDEAHQASQKYTDDEDHHHLNDPILTNMIILKNLDQACRNVQIQALELIRSRHLVTASGVHPLPADFLLIALVATDIPGPPYLTPHLNDYFFISHTHDPSDPLPHLESPPREPHPSKPPITHAHLTHLRAAQASTSTTAELRRYMHNLTTFLRLHRAVAGGISALATRQVDLLSRILPPLHGISYTTPSLVALAFRKVYAHRVEVARAETERSVKWGSDVEVVRRALVGVRPDGVLGDVLEGVEGPL